MLVKQCSERDPDDFILLLKVNGDGDGDKAEGKRKKMLSFKFKSKKNKTKVCLARDRLQCCHLVWHRHSQGCLAYVLLLQWSSINYYCSRLFSKIESANHIIFLPHPRVQQILTAHESAMLILHPTVKEVHLRWKSNPYMVPPDELKRGTERQQNVLLMSIY